MAFTTLELFGLFSTLIVLCIGFQYDTVFAHVEGLESLSRKSFPVGFLFGAGSSAYQFEGAWNKDGRAPSIWDNFTSEFPEKIADHSNGDVAEEFYYRYKDDIKMMKDMGIDIFRISISWSRILPHGKISRGINQLGIQFYNDLINKLLSKGIKPFVTLLHYDSPQALEDEYGGFLSSSIVDDFRDYADLCFKLFGDRVKHWITINEPNGFSSGGYASGGCAPGRCSDYIGNCTFGDSATEPYLVTHHLLLSHASAFRLYHSKYKENQGGVVGLTIATDWIVPINQTQRNVMAASRAVDFSFGWILNPIIMGEYPEIMRKLVGKRLPEFTEKEKEMVKGSYDYLGMNYYTGSYAEDDPSSSNSSQLSYTTDSRVTLTNEKDGVPIGEPTDDSSIYIYPQGLRDLLHYMMEKYDNPPLIITENGMAYRNDVEEPIEDALEDYERIKYHQLHLLYLQRTIKDGANVSGYLVWSFMDDFEWAAGFTLRFGFNFVDRRNNLTRTPKLSASWYRNFLSGENGSTGLIQTF